MMTGIGIIPTGSIVRLLRDGHDGLNSLLTYTGARFSAQRMQEMGFLHQVVNTLDELGELATVLAEQIVLNAPLALRAAKRVKSELAAQQTTKAMDIAESIRRTLDNTADCAEGLAAFAEKRPPVFIGQ